MTEPTSFASPEAGFAMFDSLASVSPIELVGLWQGEGIASGHPLDGVLENLGWYGKRFHADRRADALLFQIGGGRRLVPVDPSGLPVRLLLRFQWLGKSGAARNLFSHLLRSLWAKAPVASVRAMAFRGQSSAAMVYDRQPITDHFRRISDDQLLGVMCVEGDPRPYFFTLRRIAEGTPVTRDPDADH
jgi:hypothetical protein